MITAMLAALSDALASVKASDSADPAHLAAHIEATVTYLTAPNQIDENKGRYALKRLARLILDGQTSLAQVREQSIDVSTPRPVKENWLLALAMQVAAVAERTHHLPLLDGPVGAVVHGRWGREQACSAAHSWRGTNQQMIASIRTLRRGSTWIRLMGFYPSGKFDRMDALLRRLPHTQWGPVFAKMAEAEAILNALENDPKLLKAFKREHNLTALRAPSPAQREAADRARIEAIVYQDRNAPLKAQASSARQVFRPVRPVRPELD